MCAHACQPSALAELTRVFYMRTDSPEKKHKQYPERNMCEKIITQRRKRSSRTTDHTNGLLSGSSESLAIVTARRREIILDKERVTDLKLNELNTDRHMNCISSNCKGPRDSSKKLKTAPHLRRSFEREHVFSFHRGRRVVS